MAQNEITTPTPIYNQNVLSLVIDKWNEIQLILHNCKYIEMLLLKW